MAVRDAVSISTRASYHHGDLRSALLSTAMELLEEGEPFSLRAVARRAGVSPNAPYRHYADKDALESALAGEGFRDLADRLAGSGSLPASVADLADLGVIYVAFALDRPALFRLMFGNACDDSNDERARAAADIRAFMEAAITGLHPGADVAALATAGWALVHGLAFLHLDNKLPADDREQVADRVRSSIIEILTAGLPV